MTEFGESMENLQTHSKLTGKCLFDVNFHFFWLFVSKKKENKMSLENLQTLSKLKKICVHNFSSRKICVQPVHKKEAKKFVHAYSFLSLERVWREFGDSPNSFCFRFFLQKKVRKNENWHQTNTSLWAWSEFGDSPNSLQSPLQTRSKLICFQKFIFIFSFCVFFGGGEKGSELGDSPNSLQTGSKPICVQSVFLYCFWNRSVFGVTWRLSKLSWVWNTNARTTNILFLCGQELKCSNVSMRLRSEFGHSPNSLQTHSKFKCFPQF